MDIKEELFKRLIESDPETRTRDLRALVDAVADLQKRVQALESANNA